MGLRPLLVLLILLPLLAWGQDFTVKGLFKNAIVVVVDGRQHLIKQGKTKQGITLIEADSKSALIEINGQRQRVGVSTQVGGSYRAPSKKTVRIASQENGHHWVRGQINGRTVDFLVDTGASMIAMNFSTAKRLGIDPKKGRLGWSSTANGVKQISQVKLDKVTVGEITLRNIDATVGLDDSLPVILLGNSFLSRVNMRTEQGVLILESQ